MNKPNIKPQLTTLEKVDESRDIRLAIDRDFGSAIEDLSDGVSRRRWLQLMGASLALGGMSGCRYEEEKIAPFAFRPQNRIPGVPDKYSAVIDFCGVAQPLVATCYDGRPIKLDGNPDHPASKGASTTFTQATILNLYDPDRLRSPMSMSDMAKELKWEDVLTVGKGMLGGNDLSSVAIISEEIGSPSLNRLKDGLVGKGANWFVFSSFNDDNTRAGAKAAFGKAVRSHFDLEKAKVIVSIDADPLKDHPDALSNSIKFGAGRDADHGHMNRLYVVESQYTNTGSNADHRISVPSSRIAGFVGALAKAIENTSTGKKVDAGLSYRDKVLACMAQDLADNAGDSVIICGERQPAAVHAAVHALNEQLGNNGKTVTFTQLVDEDREPALKAVQSLASQIKSGAIKSLLVLGGNPVFTAPLSLGLADAIKSVDSSIHVTSHKNETTMSCKWALNKAHQLESWSDGWAYDGSVCIGQPLILPLWGGRSEVEILSAFMGDEASGIDIVKKTQGLDAKVWSKAVHDGFVADTHAERVSVSVGDVQPPPASDSWKGDWDQSTYEVVFSPSSSVYDGRFSNNAWLQELPDFLTKLTWGNAAAISPKTAEKLGVKTGQTINIGDVGLPVVIQPGQAHGTIGLTAGYGRTVNGMVGGNIESGQIVGIDVNPLRTMEGWNFGSAPDVTRTGTIERLAMVQEPWDIDDTGRDEIQARMFRNKSKKESDRSSFIREGTFESYSEFMAKSAHGHEQDGHGEKGGHDEHAKTDKTALPVLTNVSFTDEKEDDHGGGHGGHHNWPEAFHLHHKPFDITPGARMDYTAEDPTRKNMWGMGIDLNKCNGCNACVMACQAENNVPIVGKDQVIRGREMHWIRMDRYYGRNLYNDEAAADDDKQVIHQPVACHHCENAPCETVCPVAATVHSDEGLNDMVYNRCIGTRYCGNNCPYKVRRFNYMNYSDATTFLKYPEFKSLGVKGADKLSANDRSVQNLMMNPEVSIRSRGVMEKCTYCTQRISLGRIKAKTEKNRPIGPNEITTACQDVCPTGAITFGDINNMESDVRKAHDNPRSYVMMEELNNYPRTKYLARVRNPNPALIDSDDRNSVRGHAKHEDEHTEEKTESKTEEKTETPSTEH